MKQEAEIILLLKKAESIYLMESRQFTMKG